MAVIFERIAADGYEIRLRLDWTDLDANGDPMLDADFFRRGEQKPIKRMTKIAAHQTPKGRNASSSKYSYKFEFMSLSLQLIPQITNIRNQSGKARIMAAEKNPLKILSLKLGLQTSPYLRKPKESISILVATALGTDKTDVAKACDRVTRRCRRRTVKVRFTGGTGMRAEFGGNGVLGRMTHF